LTAARFMLPFDLEAEEDGCVMVTISNLVSGGQIRALLVRQKTGRVAELMTYVPRQSRDDLTRENPMRYTHDNKSYNEVPRSFKWTSRVNYPTQPFS
jgi:hypothetical protein